MGRPKLNIAYMCPDDFPCEECERGHSKLGKVVVCTKPTDAEKIAALLDALRELGDMNAIVAWIRELRDQKKIFIFEGSGRFDPKHIIVAADYPRPDDEGAL